SPMCMPVSLAAVLECVLNVSEGRDQAVIDVLTGAAGPYVLDVHTDSAHNRSVLTMAGDEQLEGSVRTVTALALTLVDIRRHTGAHPRLGAVDVVPFVPLDGATMTDAVGARDRFATWAGDELGVPCFVYGPDRSLPNVRKQAFDEMSPDTGPAVPHPTAGAISVGARPVLVAYNVWLARRVGIAEARRVATQVRGPAVRALGLDVGGQGQVSMNLVDPIAFGPAAAYDAVAALAPVERAELVGLLPAAVLGEVAESRWSELDLGAARTIESHLAAR
nr:glutamate formiminotransferase [Actinomycetota bacterium]